MELGHALDRISEIHGHLVKSEVYRGYRPAPVALSGVAALAAAALEPRLVPAGAPLASAVLYWVVVAAACALLCAAEIARGYLREDAFARRTTRHVLGQFVPCLAAGAAVTAAALRVAPALTPLLPGLWSIFFGLGIFASRPYLPRATGWVSFFYLAAGSILLCDPGGAAATARWGMGLVFGIGQLLAAVVLWRNLERSRDV